MQTPHDTYKPYLIHRVECRYDPEHRKGIFVLCDYDYMGSAEFEFGAVRRAHAATRDMLSCGADMMLVKVPLTKPVDVQIVGSDGAVLVQYDAIYALAGAYMADCYAFDEFAATVNRLVHEKEDTKEFCYFNRDFAMWHDLANDVYFSFNEAWLRLVYSMLCRADDFVETVQTKLAVGDEITIAKVLNGKALHSVTRMETVTGKIVGILETGVVVKRYGKKYRMPFEYIINKHASDISVVENW